MAIAFPFSLALLGLSGLLIDSHRRSWWRARESEQLPDAARRFARTQYRRRMQASGTIGLIGLAIGLGPLVPREPLSMAFYLATLLAACTWIMLLALIDVWATRQHFRRLRDEHVAAQIRLAMEMRETQQSSDSDA